jgi:NAD dependent epimerase/dehydratase
MQGQRVVVTGAGGFIGSHLCEELVRRGANVRALTHYNGRNDRGNLEDLPASTYKEIEFRPGDVRDPFSCSELIRGADSVFHLAALVAIPYSYLAPASVTETNVMGTLNVLEAARQHETQRVLLASSSETYGSAQHTPIDELHPLQAQSPYAASKIAAEKLAQSYWCSYQTPVVTVRPFNTYGPRQSARAFIPSVLSQALWGDRVRVGSLYPVRDLTYVSDTVAGLIRAATEPDVAGEVFNLGTGKAQSMEKVLEEILDLVDREVPVESDPSRERPNTSEVDRLIADPQKSKDVLGWKPRIELSEGLQRTRAWVESHRDRFKVDVYNV